MPADQTLNIENFQVGEIYTRKTVADTGQVPRPKQDRDWSGIVSFENCVLLFVTLDKTDFTEFTQYCDNFSEDGEIFYWDSQSRNTPKTPVISRLISGDTAIVFVRIAPKLKGKTQPFTYVGKLSLLDYEGEKPVQMVFDVVQHSSNPPENLRDIYNWEPEGGRQLRQLEIPEQISSKKRNAKERKGNGQGRQIDPAKKKAIELRAMDVARDHYEALGYSVEDTSNNNPFDFLCKNLNEERRVEVKGTVGGAKGVKLTANEVKSARDEKIPTDLFVVFEIEVHKQAHDFFAKGGQTKILKDWNPNDQDLTPTQYDYRLPN
ncbi:DUF3427 domain-containing protein [bacterium]|nr:DUF3427 domain-containing protein [bacterium]MDB4786087.1 DUF3427 domain-containing protein [bacterium]